MHDAAQHRAAFAPCAGSQGAMQTMEHGLKHAVGGVVEVAGGHERFEECGKGDVLVRAGIHGWALCVGADVREIGRRGCMVD